MGRIGKRVLTIPAGVEVKVHDNRIEVKGPKGMLCEVYNPAISIEVKDKTVRTVTHSNDKKHRALQGLYNSLIKNMLDGVIQEFVKKLEIVGVGYRAQKQGSDLHLQMGFSHPIVITPPKGIEIGVEGTNKLFVKGIDRRLVGKIASEIRAVREVEPYKGKGIKYEGEKARKKAGKAAKTAAGA